MLFFESIQGLAAMNVYHKYEKSNKEIFFIYRVNGAYLMNIARKRVN